MKYKVYYLTSDKDFNIPMYIGATRKTLEERLRNHKSECYLEKKGNIALNWKKSRRKSLKIYLIQDNISLENIENMEVFWIDFWRKINPNLKNTNKYIRYCIKPEHLLIEKTNLSEKIKKAVAHRNKPIIVLNKDGTFYNEYPSVKSCAKELGYSQLTTISFGAKDKIRTKRFNFVYKSEYDPNKDYSYKNTNKRTVFTKMNKKCWEASAMKRRRRCMIENESGQKTEFDSLRECSKFLNVVESTVHKKIKLNIPHKGYKIKYI